VSLAFLHIAIVSAGLFPRPTTCGKIQFNLRFEGARLYSLRKKSALPLILGSGLPLR
jgi:hypothetical protein